MIYLLSGEDSAAKERHIAAIKAMLLTSDSALTLDYEVLHADKLDADDLKKSLLSLPAVSPQRLILLRQADKLDAHGKEIILDFIRSGPTHAVLVLDSAVGKNTFLAPVKTAVKVIDCFTRGRRQDVFDMASAIERRDSLEALKILDQLMGAGEHPLKIIGGVVWAWGKRRNRMSAGQFRMGLKVLQEADLNIKRSRLKPEHAVEIAVTKLSAPIAG